MNGKKNGTHGGAGRGQGRKKAEEKGIEKRQQFPLTILPSVLEPLREKYGRHWGRRVEELIKIDLLLQQQNGHSSMEMTQKYIKALKKIDNDQAD